MIILPTYRTNAHNCFENHCRYETHKTISICGIEIGNWPLRFYSCSCSNNYNSKIQFSNNRLSDV
jgi:hypothetical protein